MKQIGELVGPNSSNANRAKDIIGKCGALIDKKKGLDKIARGFGVKSRSAVACKCTRATSLIKPLAGRHPGCKKKLAQLSHR
eukprot:3208019-Alexandrium_andersonii.AAC.1